MELTVENLEGGFRCIKLSGRLDLKGTQAADPQFTAQVGALKQSVIVDLSGVDYIASVGIRMLIANVKPLSAAGAKLVFLKPQKFVEDVLKMAGVDSIDAVAIEHDPVKALALVKGGAAA
jgi:anti-anti-sigma factor